MFPRRVAVFGLFGGPKVMTSGPHQQDSCQYDQGGAFDSCHFLQPPVVASVVFHPTPRQDGGPPHSRHAEAFSLIGNVCTNVTAFFLGKIGATIKVLTQGQLRRQIVDAADDGALHSHP